MGSLSINVPEANGTTFSLNPLDPIEFRRQGHMIIDFLADYYENVHKYPVRSQVEPGYLQKLLPESTPYYPESLKTILSDIKDHIIPVFMAMCTLPALYEGYEAQVDAAGEKAMIEAKKQYAVLDANVLQQIPRGPFSNKKQH